MSGESHDRWSEELAAYLLGALEPGEAAALERHAEGCERCRAEMRWLAPAMQAVQETVERVEPPAALRQRLLAEVREDARREGTAAGAGEGTTRGRIATWLDGLRARPLGLRPIAGLAAVALVVAAIAGYAIGTGGSGSGGGGGGTNTIVSGQAPGIVAKMVSEGDSGTLHLENVKPLPREEVLEAWVQRGTKVAPVRALFVPDREGRASTMIADMRGVEVVMVTEEPKGGSDAPTSKPIVTMPIPVQ